MVLEKKDKVNIALSEPQRSYLSLVFPCEIASVSNYTLVIIPNLE